MARAAVNKRDALLGQVAGVWEVIGIHPRIIRLVQVCGGRFVELIASSG